jgi:RHS repeat-associated protein
LFVNEGTSSYVSGEVDLSRGAEIKNMGTFVANAQYGLGFRFDPEEGTAPSFVNTGTFEKTEGTGTTWIGVAFENLGAIHELSGHFHFINPIATRESSAQWGGAENPSAPSEPHPTCGDPVSCATGNYSEAQTDFAIGGRGVGLALTRTYNSQAAAEGVKGAFGYGWTSSFSDHLVVNKTSKVTTLHQANGSTVPFTEEGGGSFKAPAWTQDTLSGTEGTGYTLTLADQVKYKFAGSSGRLESITDRDGNATTLTYNEAGQLTTITDPASRTIKLKYNGEGFVESAEDPMKHVVKYTYEGENLKSVTQPAEESLRWQFKYDGSHRMTEMVDGRSGKTINEYDESNQVTKQEDPAGHKLKFEYETFQTKITNENTGSVTDEYFTSNDEPSSITRGYGTASATTESFTYNEGGYVTSVTDGNGHTTTYGYNAANDRTSMVDPNKNETKWTYDSTHDVETMTTPKGETTTIKREAHGNPEVIERPAPESKTQTTKYKYKTTGELESVENPLKNVWKYEYDAKGDRTAEIDPIGNKRTWEYNEDSQETATVSPRGNIKEGKPAEFTTKIERDTQGRALKVTDPLSHVTEYKYDGDGNVETITDGNKHKTKYTYNGDNQPTKVEAPNKTVTETEYNGAGQVIKQIDGNKHATEYKRNAVGEATEVINALGKKTLKEYDAAGNLVKLTDPKSRTTTYTYDPANRLTEVSYSSGKPATVKYEYDKDGDRTKMTDGTGTTTYVYDQLDRQTESENGHKEVIKYEYDLANDQTKITYPNKKAVTRAFDKDGRLEKLTDWLSHSTKFTYNEDSDLKIVVFPSETKDEDTYAYNDADQMSEVKMKKSTEVLASLVYTRDSDGQVKKTTSKGLPGAEVTENTYDENNRLTKYGSTEYKYDSANNPTKEGSSTNTFNEGDELEKGTGTTYAYDELGERTKTTPEKGGATTYGYDQAGNLTSVERPEKESVPKIEDSYTYDGNGLRASQTINGTTSYLAWDMAEGLPLILSDGTNSYIYGPGGLSVEQISGAETPTYLHHDQQGSIRLLTGSAGTSTGSITFDAYGNKVESTGSTSPLGYDGQYTSSDTGLIYLQARVYDPTTAQFLTVDPAVSLTREPYVYVGDNSVNLADPNGLEAIPVPAPVAGGCAAAPEVCGAAAVGGADVWLGVKVFNAWAGEEAGNDEGEAELHTKEAERESEQGCGKTPPGYDPETWTKGPASRPSDPGENFYDPEGGEWRWHAPDKYHPEGHWDYKGHGKSAPWENIYP